MTLHLAYLLFNAKRNKILCKIYLFSVVALVDNFRLHWHTLGWCNVRSAVNRVWYKNTKLLFIMELNVHGGERHLHGNGSFTS